MPPYLSLARAAAIVVAVSGIGTTAYGQAATPAPSLTIEARIPGPDGGWDYATFDAARRRIYVAHGDTVMSIDADTGQANANFASGAHLHAVVPVPGTNLLVTTNGGSDSANVLDAATGRMLSSVTTAKDPDGAVFDPSSNLVVVVNGDVGLVSLLDPKSAKVVGTIAVGAGLEFPAVDGKGRLYVNIEETGEIAVIDVAARKVLARYPMPGCKSPTGLALTADGRLISACANGVAKIVEAASGREIASLAIGARPDAVLLDEARGVAYIPSGMTGTLAVIALSGKASNSIVETIHTQLGARTGAVDLKTGKIYLPTAQYLLPAPAGKRPEPKPGTFEVLVLSRR